MPGSLRPRHNRQGHGGGFSRHVPWLSRLEAVKVAVLFGGTSEERDVSIASAAQIVPALRNLGHQVFAVDTATGRLGSAQERQLLSAAVAAAPPSDMEIARVRGGAMTLSPA